MTVLAVTPARGGSKGIPGKNVKMIAGRPLIAWSIEAAQESKLIDKYVVSTDDKEIKRVAMEYGAEVLDRPAELAQDDSTILSVLQHTINEVPCDTLVLLQPPAPVRNKGRIDECISLHKSHPEVDAVVTGFNCYYYEYGAVKNAMRRQDVKGFFTPDGNVYVYKASMIRSGRSETPNYLPVYTTPEENIDIDDMFLFWVAEKVLLKRMGKDDTSKR